MNAGNNTRILAIDPASRGFGYAVLEGGSELIDWGVAATNRQLVAQRFSALLQRFAPELVVLSGSRSATRRTNAASTAATVTRIAEESGVPCRQIDRRRIAKAFPVRSKHALAASIAARFPELASRLPPPRKPWMSEDYRMSIFDATAAGIAVVETSKQYRPEGAG